MIDRSEPVVIRYERDGDLVRLTLTNVTNHELREVILGLWCRLDLADRVDHIDGLLHYSDPDEDSWLSPVAAAVKSNPGDAKTVDLAALANRGEKVRP